MIKKIFQRRYLALVTALATEADYVFVPESPEDENIWKDKMCEKCQQVFQRKIF